MIIIFFLWCRKLAKSTFLLVSLFGLQYVLFAFFPDQVSVLTFKIRTFIELALASTQVMIYSSTSLSFSHTHRKSQVMCIYIALFIIHTVSKQKISVLKYLHALNSHIADQIWVIIQFTFCYDTCNRAVEICFSIRISLYNFTYKAVG